MNNYFECKVKFEKLLEDGLKKQVTENYLVEATNHAEAENRIATEMEPYISGEFSVEGVRKVKYAEIIGANKDEGDHWYKTKVVFLTFDEEKGTEKRRPVNMLVKAASVEDGLCDVRETMSGTVSDYEIAAIAETPILDFYPYAEPTSEEAFYEEDEDEENVED
jgi:hypothetical protein